MALRFRGEFPLRVDDKCRLAVPTSYRQTLLAGGDARLVLSSSLTDKCLIGWPLEEWTKLEDKVASLPYSNKHRQFIQRMQIAGHQLLEPDGHGRIVIPPSLRAEAGIQPNGEVVVASGVDRFEIWARELYQTRKAQHVQEGAEPAMQAELAEMGF